MTWPHAQYQQQPSIFWPKAQQHTLEQQLSMPHTPEQLPMPRLAGRVNPGPADPRAGVSIFTSDEQLLSNVRINMD